MLDFRILGPLEVVAEDGRPVPLGGPKQRATLAILLLHGNRTVSVDQLADDLYAGAPPVTAVTQVQRQISDLRKALGRGIAIQTRPPGYVLRLDADQFDLHRFERLVEEGRSAFSRGEAEAAADLFDEGLRLWRGAPLADLAYEPFAQIPIDRLEEMRLATVEERIDAGLALGRHTQLIGELEQLTAEHPLRERFKAQLMLALYRSGRQREALDVFQRTRRVLVDELGIKPGPALRELERAILAQDPGLELALPGQLTSAKANRTTLVVPRQDDGADDLLRVAEVVARLPGRDLIVARLLSNASAVNAAARALSAQCASLQVPARSAAFTSGDLPMDILRLATAYDIELVLLDAPPDFAAEHVPDELAAVFQRSSADVALLAGRAVHLSKGAGVFVPFGGGDHDWAALELGASLAAAANLPLRLIGTKADRGGGRRDASRLLADASLAVQRVAAVQAEPVLAEPSTEALVAAVEPATLVVAGVSPRWRREGIGGVRRALFRDASAPALFVHRGLRPGALAPRESRTRFTWSIEA